VEKSGDNLKNTSTIQTPKAEKPASFVRFEEAMRRIVKVPKEETEKRESAKIKMNGNNK